MEVRMRSFFVRGLLLHSLPLILLAVGSAVRADDDSQRLQFFEQKIRPVLVQHCYKCHSAESAQVRGGLLLDSRAGLLQGGDSGPAVVPGDVQAGQLLAALRHES
ncbi:MAG: c-type cytochrome domain-containing protein, partial [Planctomycetaceae bacterium]